MYFYQLADITKWIKISQVADFSWRLILPVILIFCFPLAENLFQHVFLGEGIYRVFHYTWSVRASQISLFKAGGLSCFLFGLEECLQELLLVGLAN